MQKTRKTTNMFYLFLKALCRGKAETIAKIDAYNTSVAKRKNRITHIYIYVYVNIYIYIFLFIYIYVYLDIDKYIPAAKQMAKNRKTRKALSL